MFLDASGMIGAIHGVWARKSEIKINRETKPLTFKLMLGEMSIGSRSSQNDFRLEQVPGMIPIYRV